MTKAYFFKISFVNEGLSYGKSVVYFLLSKDWEKARETKKSVEERQREVLRERESRGKNWVPKHLVSYSKEEGWECSPIHKSVPNAPIATL